MRCYGFSYSGLRAGALSGLSFVVLFSIGLSLRSAERAVEKQHFLDEYSPAKRQLAEFYGSVNMSGVYKKIGWPAFGGRERVEKIDLRNRPGMVRIESAIVTEDGGEGLHVAHVATEGRSFAVTREVGNTDFALASLAAGSKSELDRIRLSFPAATAPFGYFEQTVEDWLAEPTLNVIVVESVPGDGLEHDGMVKLTYERPVSAGDGTTGVEAGEFAFYPEKSWALAGYAVGPKGSVWRRRGRLTYDGTIRGMPVLKNVEYWIDRLDGEREQIEVFEIEDVNTNPAPASDFTLAAFGIEAVGDNAGADQRRRLYFWLLIGGAVLLAIGSFFKRRSGRHEGRASRS